MVKIAFATVVCASLCLGPATVQAEPPGHARHGWAKTEKKDEKGLLERAVDEVLGRRDGDRHGRQRQNPNSNAQWLPDAKRGQERAAERRPAHAGPGHRDDEHGLLDTLLGGDERQKRAKSKRAREEKLGKLRKQKRQKADGADDLVEVLVEKVQKDKRARN